MCEVRPTAPSTPSTASHGHPRPPTGTARVHGHCLRRATTPACSLNVYAACSVHPQCACDATGAGPTTWSPCVAPRAAAAPRAPSTPLASPLVAAVAAETYLLSLAAAAAAPEAAEARDVSPEQLVLGALKHSWKGGYARVLRLSADGLATLTAAAARGERCLGGILVAPQPASRASPWRALSWLLAARRTRGALPHRPGLAGRWGSPEAWPQSPIRWAFNTQADTTPRLTNLWRLGEIVEVVPEPIPTTAEAGGGRAHVTLRVAQAHPVWGCMLPHQDVSFSVGSVEERGVLLELLGVLRTRARCMCSPP